MDSKFNLIGMIVKMGIARIGVLLWVMSGAVGAAENSTGIAFNGPSGITSDGKYLFVSDSSNNRIRKVEIDTGKVSTLAGSLKGAVDGVGTAAGFRFPNNITYVGGYLYVSDEMNRRIRKVEIATGAVTTLAGFELGNKSRSRTAALFSMPSGIVVVGENLYVADYFDNNIRKIVIATGQVTTLAGSGVKGSNDGTGSTASFNTPSGITSDGKNLYVADSFNNKIRKVVIATGEVTTLAGSGKEGASDGMGTAATFKFPENITTDGINLYVSDFNNYKIRKIEITSGVVSTLAGSGAAGFLDGSSSLAKFDHPRGVIVVGNRLYVADTLNDSVRKIEITTGAVSTLRLQETQTLPKQTRGTGDWYSNQQPDYILKTCQQVESGKANDSEYFNGVAPAVTLAAEVGSRRNLDLLVDEAALASIKSVLLEKPKHGKLIENTESKQLYYLYESDDKYTGKDKAVFMTEFEGVRYKIVMDFFVVAGADEYNDPCPKPQLNPAIWGQHRDIFLERK